MSTPTPNLALTKPAGGESADVAVLNANMDILDNAVMLSGSQTLASKTLSNPHMTTPVVDSGGLTVTAGGLVVTAGGLVIAAGGLTLTAGTLVLPDGSVVAAMIANRTRSLFLPAAAFQLVAGTPTFSSSMSGTGHWLLADGVASGVATTFCVPQDYSGGVISFYLYLAPITAGAAGSREVNITLTTSHTEANTVVGSGSSTDDITTDATSEALSITAHSRTLTSLVNSLIGVNVQRNGAAGTDDLAATVRFYGVRCDYTADS